MISEIKTFIFKKNSLIIINMFIGRISANLFGFLSLALLSRMLSTEAMGTYSLFIMIINLGLLVGVSWSDSSLVKFGREEFIETGKMNDSFNSRLILFIIGAVVVTLAYLMLGEKITSYLSLERKTILLIIFTFILNGLSGLLISIFQASDRMKMSAYIVSIQKGIFLILLLLIFFHLLPSSFEYILMAFTISFLLVVFLGIFKTEFASIRPFLITKKKTLKKVWSFSWPQLIGFSGLYIINYIDLFIIKRYLSLSDVGSYSIVYNLFNVICGIIMIVYVVFLPVIVEEKKKKPIK